MAIKMIGKGSQYAFNTTGKESSHLDGSKNYKLHIPKDVPAKDFWSVVVYDPQTCSELQTSQEFPSKNNKRHKLAVKADGSLELCFGPKAPEGKKSNWVGTVSGKGWFVLRRLYGPRKTTQADTDCERGQPLARVIATPAWQSETTLFNYI